MKRKIGIWCSIISLVFMNVFSYQVVSAATSGDGTAENPFIITTCQELQDMRLNLVAYYELGNDIDCSDTKTWNSGQGFLPIGNNGAPFRGFFDGNNYTIKNLYINRTSAAIGLFGQTGLTGVYPIIENFYLTNVDITSPTGTSSSSGGVVGIASTNTTIRNVYVSGKVTGDSNVGGIAGNTLTATLQNVYSTVSLKGNTSVGGVAGYVFGGKLSKAFYNGHISSSFHVGGITGMVDKDAIISESAATGTIDMTDSGYMYKGAIGGFTGEIVKATVTDSFSRVNITCTPNCTSYGVGGFVGSIDYRVASTVKNTYSTGSLTTDATKKGGWAGDYNPTYANNVVENAFWNTTTSGLATSAGGVKVIGLTDNEMKQQLTFPSPSWDFTSVWTMNANINNGYPYLQSLPLTKPFEVKNLSTSTPDEESVTLAWENPVDEEYGRMAVYRNDIKIADTPFNNYTDTTVTPGETYVYTLKPVDIYGRETSSASTSVTMPNVNPPSPVQSVAILETEQGIKLAWENPTNRDFQFVKIERNGQLLYQGQAIEFTDTTTDEKTAYTYDFIAYDTNGNPSTIVSKNILTKDKTPTSAVSNIQVTEVDEGVYLSWSNPADSDFDYVTVEKNGVLLYQGALTEFIDSSINEKTSYTYTFTAYDEEGNVSTMATSTIVTADKTAPAAVSNAQVTEENDGIHLSWNNPNDNDFDHVTIKKNGVLVYQGNFETYVDSTFTEETTYTYSIAAFDSTGNPSSIVDVNITTLDKTPTASITNLQATEETGGVHLSWNNPSDLDFHHVNVLRDGALIYQGTASSYIDTTINEKTSYTYTVTAFDEVDNASAIESTSLLTADNTPTAPVSNVQVTEEADGIHLSWSNPVDGDFGQVVVERNGEVVYQGSAASFIDNTAAEETAYSYAFTAYDISGNASTVVFVNIVTQDKTATDSVTNLQAEEQTDGVHLTWLNPNDSDFDHVIVERDGQEVYQGAVEMYVDSDTQEGTTYTYTVTAYDTSNNPSTAASIGFLTNDNTAPAPVSDVQVVQTEDKLTLTWQNPSNDVSSVEVYKNNQLVYNSGMSSSYEESGFAPYEQVTYKIVTVDSNENKTETTLVFEVQPWLPLAPVSNVTASKTSDSVSLSWTNPDDRRLARVDVYRNGELLSSTTGDTYYDGDVTPYTTYTYDLITVDTDGNATPLVNVTLQTNDKTPVAPTAFAATFDYGQVKLSWNKSVSTHVKGYEIYRNGTLIKQVNANSYIDESTEPGTTATYKMRAITPTSLYSTWVTANVAIPPVKEGAEPEEKPGDNSERTPLPATEKPTTETKTPPTYPTPTLPTETDADTNLNEKTTQEKNEEVEPTQTEESSKTTESPEAVTEGTQKDAEITTPQTLTEEEALAVFKKVEKTVKITKKKKGYHLSWKADEAIKEVEIYRNDKLIATTTANSYTDTKVSTKKKPTYRLVFVMGNGKKLSKTIKAKAEEVVTNIKEKAVITDSRISKGEVLKVLIPSALFLIIIIGGAAWVATQRQTA
ncbi:hypothetical protein CN918_31035 [Priestia megaterium]|nr:hypothetical protein CN918_31035 [Priestia megaterium]